MMSPCDVGRRLTYADGRWSEPCLSASDHWLGVHLSGINVVVALCGPHVVEAARTTDDPVLIPQNPPGGHP